jgi:putative oxidoreductase
MSRFAMADRPPVLQGRCPRRARHDMCSLKLWTPQQTFEEKDMAEHQTLVEDVHGSGIYPASGPRPPGDAIVRTPAEFGHPEMRARIPRTMPSLESAALLAARAIFGGYFVYNGVNHLVNRDALAAYARTKGVPFPDVAVAASGLLALAGGLSLIAGVRPKIGAGLISSFLLGVSPQMHAYWKETDPQARMHEMVNFTKNMALVGGAVFAAAHPEPWRWHIGQPAGTLAPAVR